MRQHNCPKHAKPSSHSHAGPGAPPPRLRHSKCPTSLVLVLGATSDCLMGGGTDEPPVTPGSATAQTTLEHNRQLGRVASPPVGLTPRWQRGHGHPSTKPAANDGEDRYDSQTSRSSLCHRVDSLTIARGAEHRQCAYMMPPVPAGALKILSTVTAGLRRPGSSALPQPTR